MLATHGEDPLGSLSDRQLEALRLVAEGHSYEEIGTRLYMSANTVKFGRRLDPQAQDGACLGREQAAGEDPVHQRGSQRKGGGGLVDKPPAARGVVANIHLL